MKILCEKVSRRQLILTDKAIVTDKDRHSQASDALNREIV